MTEQAKIALEQHGLVLIKDKTLTSDCSMGLEVASLFPGHVEESCGVRSAVHEDDAMSTNIYALPNFLNRK